MVRSMTAFARVNAGAKGRRWSVEIRSVNHRYFDFSAKLPQSLNVLETKIRDLVNSEIKRGKVNINISRDSAEDEVRNISLNKPLLKTYEGMIRRLRKQFKLKGDPALADILALPGIFASESSQDAPEKDWAVLEKVLKQVLKQTVAAKELEGGKLARDIAGRLKSIVAAVDKIEMLAKDRTEIIYQKLSERVAKLLEESGKDPERTYREVAFLAERSDVTEEVVRLRGHLDLFASRLKGPSESGRELDFLCQEMHREINTIGSKSQLFEISTEVVFVKSELEKIREQVQNIE